MEKSFLCGYLTIKNLTAACPVMTTFFEAEIIGKDHSFYTNKWKATEDLDLSHWVAILSFAEQI
jgi:hypothetical protein